VLLKAVHNVIFNTTGRKFQTMTSCLVTIAKELYCLSFAVRYQLFVALCNINRMSTTVFFQRQNSQTYDKEDKLWLFIINQSISQFICPEYNKHWTGHKERMQPPLTGSHKVRVQLPIHYAYKVLRLCY